MNKILKPVAIVTACLILGGLSAVAYADFNFVPDQRPVTPIQAPTAPVVPVSGDSDTPTESSTTDGTIPPLEDTDLPPLTTQTFTETDNDPTPVVTNQDPTILPAPEIPAPTDSPADTSTPQ